MAEAVAFPAHVVADGEGESEGEGPGWWEEEGVCGECVQVSLSVLVVVVVD